MAQVAVAADDRLYSCVGGSIALTDAQVGARLMGRETQSLRRFLARMCELEILPEVSHYLDGGAGLFEQRCCRYSGSTTGRAQAQVEPKNEPQVEDDGEENSRMLMWSPARVASVEHQASRRPEYSWASCRRQAKFVIGDPPHELKIELQPPRPGQHLG
jgi:hypothetical protein